MEKMVQQMAQGAGWFRLERGRGIWMDELCNLPEPIRGELESVSSSRMLLPSSEPRPGVPWSEMIIGLSPLFATTTPVAVAVLYSISMCAGWFSKSSFWLVRNLGG